MRNLLLCAALLGVITSSGYAVYRYGYKHGSRDVKLEWEQDKAAARAAHDALLARIAKQEEVHRQAQEKVAHDAEQARQTYEVALAAQRTGYEQRLLQSTHRAALYRNQAQADAVARSNLADHAARLDRALEEGRGLVGELAATLRLRDAQLTLLGEQIRNDRALLGH